MADDGYGSPPGEHEVKAYHPKRPHKKSRKGCKNCKTRKVKCDETRPTCRSCRLRKVECIYAPSSPSQADVDAASPSASFSLVPGGSQSPSLPTTPQLLVEPLFCPSSTVDNIDMRLLWFYTTSTYTSFSVASAQERPIEDVMKNALVRYAFETPFLMHSIFALAGLHLQSLGQPFETGRALAYRAKAFEGYRQAIQEAKPETFPALMANSLLLTALSSQSFREPDCPELYIIDWMIVWRGIGLMFDLTAKPEIFESDLGALFYRPSIDLDKSVPLIPNNLLFMISSIKPDDLDYPHVGDYYDTLRYLGSLYLGLEKGGLGPIMNLRIITWFTFVPRPFIELCRQRRPRALVILGHYAVFLKMIQDIWWVKNVGDRSIRDVCNYVDPEWHLFLEVASAAASIDDQLEIARLLLGDPNWVSPELQSDGLQKVLASDQRARVWVDDEGQELMFVGESRDGRQFVRRSHPAGDDRPRWSR